MIGFRLLPFDEAIDFFRDKVPMKPDQYRRLEADAKAKAFTIAGTSRTDVIGDMYGAIDKAISTGTTYQDFKKDVKGIMATRGWVIDRGHPSLGGVSPNLSLPHRLDTIFRTNIQQAYQAGHYQRQKELAKERPYWQYVAVMDGRVRPAHAAMNGTILPADDPFWSTSYPPNGFRCRCTVRSLSKGEFEREGGELATNEPGIADPGFDNNPGEVAWRDAAAKRGIDDAAKERWTPLITSGAREAGRPDKVPYDPLPAKLGPTLKELGGDKDTINDLYHAAIGGASSSIDTPDGSSILMSDYLLTHLTMDGREAYFPLIRPLLEDPYEIWLMPTKGEKTGRVVMRKRFIRFFQDADKHRLMMVGEYQRGSFVGYTFFRGDKEGYFVNQRKGFLIYGK